MSEHSRRYSGKPCLDPGLLHPRQVEGAIKHSSVGLSLPDLATPGAVSKVGSRARTFDLHEARLERRESSRSAAISFTFGSTDSSRIAKSHGP